MTVAATMTWMFCAAMILSANGLLNVHTQHQYECQGSQTASGSLWINAFLMRACADESHVRGEPRASGTPRGLFNCYNYVYSVALHVCGSCRERARCVRRRINI